MRFIEICGYDEQQFYRLTGVKRKVFALMEEVVSAARSGRGRPPTLSVADQSLELVPQPLSVFFQHGSPLDIQRLLMTSKGENRL